MALPQRSTSLQTTFLQAHRGLQTPKPQLCGQASSIPWVVSLCDGSKEREVDRWLGTVAEEGAEPQSP